MLIKQASTEEWYIVVDGRAIKLDTPAAKTFVSSKLNNTVEMSVELVWIQLDYRARPLMHYTLLEVGAEVRNAIVKDV